MPTYPVRAPNGKTYPVTGPAGASDAELIAEVIKAYPESQFPSREQARQNRAAAPATTPATTPATAPATAATRAPATAATRAPATAATPPAKGAPKTMPGYLRGLGASFVEGNVRAGLGLATSGVDRIQSGEAQMDAASYMAERSGMPVDEAMTRLSGLAPRSAAEGAAAQQELAKKIQASGAREAALTPDIKNPVGRTLYGALQSAAATAPILAATAITRNPGIGVAMAATQAGGEQRGKTRARGGTPAEADIAGIGSGAVEAVTERIGLGFLAKSLGRTGFTKFMTGLLLREMPGEQVATHLQDFIDFAIANPEATFEDYKNSRLQATIDTGAAVLVQGALATGVHGGMTALDRQIAARQRSSLPPVPMQDADKVQTAGARPAPPTLTPTPEAPPTSDTAVRRQIIDRYKTEYNANQEDAERWADNYMAQFPAPTGTPDADTGAPIPGGPRPSVPDAVGPTPDAGPTAPVAGDEPGGMGAGVSPTPTADVGEGSAGVPLNPLTPETFEAAKADVTTAFEEHKEDLGLEELDPKHLAGAAKIIAQDPNIAPIDALTSVLEKADQTAAPTPTPTETTPVEAEPTRYEKRENASKVLADKTNPLNARVEAAKTLITYKFRFDDEDVLKRAALHLANYRTDDPEIALEAARQGVTPAKIKPVTTAAIAPLEEVEKDKFQEAVDEYEAAPAETVPVTKTVAEVLQLGKQGAAPNERIIEGGKIAVSETPDGMLRIDNLEAMERGGGNRALKSVLDIADQTNTPVVLLPEPRVSPAGAKMTPNALENWYTQRGFEKQPDSDLMVRTPVPTPTDAAPAPEEETGHMVGAVHQAAQNILSNFMVGDRVQVGPSQGIVVGLDGDHVRVHPDSAKNPKAYNRISKAQVKLVSRPDSAATVSASKTPDQETKFGTEAGQLNADMAGLIQLLGANMYAANLADVSVKELLQNAFDAVKGAVSSKKAPALYESGRIEITLDSQERTITIKDNARGMTPDIVRDAFFTVAGSDKSDLSPEDRSGGLGLAKMGFMMGAERLVLDTVRDGVRVHVDATSKDIAGSNFKITKSAAPKDEHGTTVTVKVPETYTDPKTGEAKTIWFPYSKGSVDILEKPLIGPVEVQFTYKRAYGDPEVETLPMGVNFPYDKYQKLTVNFDWGTADIYYGKEHKKSPSHQVLSSGVYQFNERFKLSQTETIPYDIIVNVKAAVEAKHPDYPFENSRERFKGRLKEDMSSLGLYLAKIARGAEAADLKETMQNVVSLPRVEIGENPDALEGKLEKSFEKKDTAKGQHELPTMPKEVFISDKGVLDNKGHVVVDSAKEAEKKKQSTFEAETAAPTSEDFMIEIDQDPKNPIFHNNTSFDPIEVGKPYGNPAAFFAELGSILVEMKELLAQSGRYGYDVLSPENMFYAGIAIDKQYGGLHIKVPYKAVLINPFYDWGARTLAGVRANILNVMIHEIAHTGDMRHGEGHNAEMVKTELYLADEGMLDYFRDAIMDTLLRHESTFTAMRDEYGRSTTQNVAKSLEDIGKEASAGSAARRDDGGSENAPRAVPAGGGRGRGSNLRAASGNNPKSKKLGGSGKASAGVAAAKTKASKGLRQAQQAADAKDFMDGISTVAAGHNGSDFIPALVDNLDEIDNAVKKPLLTYILPTSRVVGKYDAQLPVLKRIQIIEQQSRGMRSRMTKAFSFRLKVMSSFVGKNGKRILGMTMHTARITSVDPTAHKNVAEAIKNDGVVKFYENLLTNPALSVNQKAAYKGKITLRTTQIRDVYSLWEDLGKQKGGQELYIKTRQYYKDMYAAIRAETTARIDKLPIPDKDKQKIKDATTKERSDDKPEKGDLFPEVPDSAFPPEYFPLKRYGKFWLRINHPKSGTGREFHTFESAGKRNAYLRMRARELGADPTSQKFFPKGNDVESLRTEFLKDSAMLKEMFKVIDSAVPESSTTLDAKGVQALRDDLFQVWLLTLPERSIRKQFLRAQKITGFDNDVVRNFASTAQSYATQLTKLKFGPMLQAELALARESITEDLSTKEALKLNMVVDALKDRVNNVLNPTPQSKLGALLNTSSFISLLTSIATALIQTSSIPIRVMPKLNVKYGYPASAAKFTRYMAIWDTLSMTEVGPDGTTRIVAPTFGTSPYVQNNPIRKRLFEAMRDDRDAFAQHSEHADLRRIALGQNGPISNVANLVMEGMTLPLSTIERLSREMTGLMAAELEYAKTKDEAKAVNVAMDIIIDTLGDYGTFERPPIMQNELGRVALQFKMYAAVQTKFLYESVEAIVGESIAAALPGEKNRGARLKAAVDAAHELAGVLLMLALIGGAGALPLYDVICLLVNLLSGRDSEKRRERIRRNPLMADDADARFRYDWLPTHLGQVPPVPGIDGKLHYWDEIAERGLVSELSGVSVGPRVSLNGLWFREPREGRTWAETSQNWLMDNFAPSLSNGMNIVGAVEDWSNGDVERGFEKVVPGFFRGPLVAKRLATEGLERKSGDKMMSPDEISDFAIMTQGLGFQPNEVADVQRRMSKAIKDSTKAEKTKSALLKDLNETRYDPDSSPEDIYKKEVRIMQHNQRYPYPPYLITNDSVNDSWSSFTSQRKRTIRGLHVGKEAPQIAPFFAPPQ